MAFDKSGKYHMNPHHAKMADAGSSKDAPDTGMPDDAGQDQAGQMITCPACGAQFPEEMGMQEHGAAATEQPMHQSSGAPPAMSGY